MTTKETILRTARRLYNARGTDAVTVRHIAASMGISHGNLCYHFPNTESIVRQLYLEIVARLDSMVASIQTIDPAAIGIREIAGYTRSVFELFYEYRFLMIDFARVMRNDHWIRDHYRDLMVARRRQFMHFFLLLREQKVIRPELVQGEYEVIIEGMILTGDFWMPRAEIMPRMAKEATLDLYMRVWMAPLPGLLTEKGLKQWDETFGNRIITEKKE